MLRRWATMFESGEEEMPRSVILVCVDPNPKALPTVYGAGREGSRLEEIGALFTAARVASEAQP
jgi:hypothetical protein